MIRQSRAAPTGRPGAPTCLEVSCLGPAANSAARSAGRVSRQDPPRLEDAAGPDGVAGQKCAHRPWRTTGRTGADVAARARAHLTSRVGPAPSGGCVAVSRGGPPGTSSGDTGVSRRAAVRADAAVTLPTLTDWVTRGRDPGRVTWKACRVAGRMVNCSGRGMRTQRDQGVLSSGRLTMSG